MKKGEEEKGKYEKVFQGRRRTNKLALKTDFIFYTEHAGRNDLEVAVHPGVTLILWVMYRFNSLGPNINLCAHAHCRNYCVVSNVSTACLDTLAF